MAVLIPSLASSPLELVAICAVVNAKDTELGEWIVRTGDTDWECGQTSDDGARQWIRLMINRFSAGESHVHIDIASSDYFEGKVPEENATLEQVHERIKYALSHRALVMVRSLYILPKSELPEKGLIARLNGLSTEISGQQLTLTGAELSIGEDRKYRLTWRMRGDSVTGRVELAEEMTLDENYLVRSVDAVRKTIDKLILEKEGRGNAGKV